MFFFVINVTSLPPIPLICRIKMGKLNKRIILSVQSLLKTNQKIYKTKHVDNIQNVKSTLYIICNKKLYLFIYILSKTFSIYKAVCDCGPDYTLRGALVFVAVYGRLCLLLRLPSVFIAVVSIVVCFYSRLCL